MLTLIGAGLGWAGLWIGLVYQHWVWILVHMVMGGIFC